MVAVKISLRFRIVGPVTAENFILFNYPHFKPVNVYVHIFVAHAVEPCGTTTAPYHSNLSAQITNGQFRTLHNQRTRRAVTIIAFIEPRLR